MHLDVMDVRLKILQRNCSHVVEHGYEHIAKTSGRKQEE